MFWRRSIRKTLPFRHTEKNCHCLNFNLKKPKMQPQPIQRHFNSLFCWCWTSIFVTLKPNQNQFFSSLGFQWQGSFLYWQFAKHLQLCDSHSGPWGSGFWCYQEQGKKESLLLKCYFGFVMLYCDTTQILVLPALTVSDGRKSPELRPLHWVKLNIYKY